MNRDEVLTEFSEGTVTKYYNVPAMADEIVRLRRILDALREPSEAAMRAGNHHMLAMYRGEKKGNKYKLPLWGVISDILPAAVEAAEEEVDDDV
jgi:hypothetical protein